MAKPQLLDVNNVIIWFKSIGASVVASILTLPLSATAYYFKTDKPVIAGIFGLFWLIAFALSFGFFANKFWKWK